MKLETKAMEVAARAIHENYYGKSTWKNATPAERGHARQAVRLTLGALLKSGLGLAPVGSSSRAPAPAPAPARPSPARPSPARPSPMRLTR